MSMMLQFTSFLRFKGLAVATSSVLNSISALQLVNMMDKDQVFYALQGCLIQKPEDRSKFKEFFYRFFEDKTPIEYETLDSLTRLEVEEFAKMLRKENDRVHDVLADYLEGDINGLMETVSPFETVVYGEGNTEVEGMNELSIWNQKKLAQKMAGLTDKIQDFTAAQYHMTREKREELNQYLRDHLEEVADILQKNTLKKPTQGHLMPWEKQRTISTIAFDKLTIKEHEKIKDDVEKLAQKFKDALTQQKKRSRKGQLDIKNTLRSSMKFGGIPFDIRRKVPARKKGKIVVFCDISMSVAYAAHLMLQFIYRLQDRFSRIRSFIFIRNAYEISHFFKEHSMEVALEKAVKEHHIGLGQLTNYGQAFKSFTDNYSSSLTKDSTLIVLGDGQNNQNDPKEEFFKDITEKVARTIWLNPEEERYWYTQTNVTLKYKPYCDELVECATLDQLSTFVRNLVI
jgi:uncharacterized protein with von Willebrand factor type A (vWA) domain